MSQPPKRTFDDVAGFVGFIVTMVLLILHPTVATLLKDFFGGVGLVMVIAVYALTGTAWIISFPEKAYSSETPSGKRLMVIVTMAPFGIAAAYAVELLKLMNPGH